MKKGFVLFFSVLFVIAIFAGGILPVYAQDSDSNEFQLEEITVTAQKRAESQQKVPIAMDVISAEEMRVSGKNNLDDILSEVSSVIIQKSADGIRISLRGLSDDSSPFHGSAVSMPTVAINMDGVVSNRKDTSVGLFDLERVEVLYGPQSTLYSTNSPGGIVNIEAAKPKLDTFEASGTLEVGNYNLLHTEGMVNVPLGDIMALRTAFTTATHDGYISNGGDSEDAKNARLRFLIQPVETFSFLLTGEYSEVANGFGNGVDQFVDESEPGDRWDSDFLISPPIVTATTKIYGRMDWDMGFASLSAIPSYNTRDGDGEQVRDMGFQVETLDVYMESEEKSIELRLASPDDFFFKWIVGFNYYESLDIHNEDTQGASNFNYLHTEEEAKAIYANATYPLTDIFRITAGFRKSWDDVVLINEEIRGPVHDPEYAYEIHGDSYSDPDYKIGFEYDLGTNTMLYADHSTSYRVQAMGGGGPVTGGESKPPEKLKAYSVGAKNRFFDNKLQLNTSAYYYDYENYAAGDMVQAWAVLGELPLGWGGTRQPMTDEAEGDPNSSHWGDGRMMGVDVQSTWVISPKDIVNMSLSYLKSEWTDLTFDFYYDWKALMGWPPPPRDAPAMPMDVEPLETVDYNGLPMTSAPEWTINGSYSHRFSLWNGGNLEAKVDGQYKTDYKLSWRIKDEPYNYQEAFFIYNANLTYNSPGGNWSLSVYGRNLSNYAEKRSYFGEPVYQTGIGNPRTYGAVLSAHF